MNATGVSQSFHSGDISVTFRRAVFCLSLLAAAKPCCSADVLRIGLDLPAGPDSVSRSIAMDIERGATLGVEETTKTGAMFGWRVELLTDSTTRETPDVILSGQNGESCGRASNNPRHVIFTLACRDASLRDTLQFPNRFHIAAVDTVYERLGAPLLWHPSLDKFGALELNARFRKRFHTDMNSYAWAAWFAVKVAFE